MSDENQVSEQSSLPTSPQEPTEPALENTAHSKPSVALPEAPESSPSDFSVKSNDIQLSDSTHIEPEKEPEIPLEPTDSEANPISNGTGPSEPEPETPQIPVNEALPESEPSVSETKEEPKPIETSEPEPEKEKPKISYLKSQK